MKSFGDPSFFRLYNALLGEGSPDPQAFEWTYRGVHWLRNRHTFTNPLYGFAIEVVLMTKSTPNAWSLLIVKEFWWERNGSSMKSGQWAKPLSGSKADIRRWVQLEERRQAEKLAITLR